PQRERPWAYIFFVDLAGHRADPRLKRALQALERRALFLKVLGSDPEARLAREEAAAIGPASQSLMKPEDLVFPSGAALNPYDPGKPIEELQRELGIDEPVKLASNENPLGPAPAA